MDERAAFEANIDRNPLDATNHGVYADWLDEHGEHDEAAFRRAMGEWHKSRNGEGEEQDSGGHARWSADVVDNPEFYSGRLPLPKGVTSNHLRPALGNPHEGWYVYSHNRVQWPSYRVMENAFRHSFMQNRQPQPEQLSRRRLSRRRYTV